MAIEFTMKLPHQVLILALPIPLLTVMPVAPDQVQDDGRGDGYDPKQLGDRSWRSSHCTLFENPANRGFRDPV